MHVFCERLRHFLTTNIRNRMECQTVVDFVIVIQVFADRIDDQTKEVRVLMHEQRHGKVTLSITALGTTRHPKK